MAEARTPTVDCVALTERERECLTLAAQGYTDAQIARKLYLTHKTVRNYMYGIYQKFGISQSGQYVCRTRAVLHAWHTGQIEPPPRIPTHARAA